MNVLWRSILLGLALTSVLLVHAAAFSQQGVQWTPLADDIELARVPLSAHPIFPAELMLARSGLRHHRVGVVRASEFGWRRASVRAMARASRAVIGINANFFDQDGRPLGLIITRGSKIQNLHRGGSTLTGVFAVSRTQVQIVNRSQLDPVSVLEAVQAGPRLLSQGARVSDLRETSSYSRRAGVCLDSHGRLILYCTSSGLVGITIEALIQVLQSSDIGCTDALNLDGGGSAQLYIGGRLNHPSLDVDEIWIEGRDEVPVMLGLFVKDET